MHMFPQSGRNFLRFSEEASNDKIVVAPDFPGHGESDPPAAPIAAEAYAAAMWEVVDGLGLIDACGDVDLFGVHAGAKLAVEMTNQRPDEVNKLVLSSAAVLFPQEVERLKNSFEMIPLDEAGSRFQHLWRLVTRNRPERMTLEMCAAAFAEILRGGERYEWGHRAVFDYNLKFPDVLKTLRHPVALLNPGDELYVMTQRSLDYLENVTLFDLPDWGHGFLDINTEEVTRIVNGWLDGHDDDKSRVHEKALNKTGTAV